LTEFLAFLTCAEGETTVGARAFESRRGSGDDGAHIAHHSVHGHSAHGSLAAAPAPAAALAATATAAATAGKKKSTAGSPKGAVGGSRLAEYLPQVQYHADWSRRGNAVVP